MSYIGSTPTSQAFAPGTDTFSGTGSQVAFTLSRNVATVNDILVIVNNVEQQPSNYSVSTSTLTFSTAPSSGTNNIYVRYLSTNLTAIAPQQGTVYPSSLSTQNALYWDTSGNVGIGTTTPAYKLDIKGTTVGGFVSTVTTNTDTSASAAAAYYAINGAVNGIIYSSSNLGATVLGSASNHPAILVTSNIERMRIDNGGLVGIGTAAPAFQFQVQTAYEWGTALKFSGSTPSSRCASLYQRSLGTAASPSAVTNGTIIGGFECGGYNSSTYTLGYNGGASIFAYAAETWTTTSNATYLQFNTNSSGTTSPQERMRIDSIGNLLVGTTDAALNSGTGIKLRSDQTTGVVVNSATGNSSHIHLYNTNATNNGYRFYVVSNGGVYNYSGNNSNLSDERTKTNIELSGNYLSKICSIPVKLFNYKDEPENEQKTLGVIAQDVEKIAPELVNNVGFGDVIEGEDALKSIYTTDMMFALMKCIQEQQALITDLQTRLAALEAK